MKTYYPPIQPFNTFFLETPSKHRVYVEQSGNPCGIAVIFLHGGPCSGTKPDQRRFFNPDHYHILLFDQRGCGQSLPFGELTDNTTQDLIADMEQIREQLNIAHWLVFGGSWGGALALLYAQQHPKRVSGLIIRAVFLARQSDMDWFLNGALGRIFPDAWQFLCTALNATAGTDLLKQLLTMLWHDDVQVQQRATQAWQVWSSQTALGTLFTPTPTPLEAITEKMRLQARMELHYAKHHYFIADNQILQRCSLLQTIPSVIIHGRQDRLCPLEAGFTLSQALPHARYTVLDNAGHIAQHEEMIAALVLSTDTFLTHVYGIDPCSKNA